jgi:hypothetical protein
MTTTGWAILVLVAAVVSSVVTWFLAPMTATEWVSFTLATGLSGFIVGWCMSRRRRHRLQLINAKRDEEALMKVEYIPATVRSLDGGAVLSTGYVSVVRNGDEMMIVTWHDEIGSRHKPIDLPSRSELVVGPIEMGQRHPR